MLSVVVTLITLCSVGVLLCFKGKKMFGLLTRFLYKASVALLGGGFKFITVFLILSTSFVGASLLGTIAIFLYHNSNDLSNYVYVDGFISTASHLTKYLTCTYNMDNDVTQVIVKLVIFITAVMTQLRDEKEVEVKCQ
ncbi:hypothetical protein AN1V17_06840 [Vallitalea sediminicola]